MVEVRVRTELASPATAMVTWMTLAQAAKNVLRKWVRELREAPQEAFQGNGNQTSQDAEIARLSKEVAKLRMERDILKKAAAYFAKESM